MRIVCFWYFSMGTTSHEKSLLATLKKFDHFHKTKALKWLLIHRPFHWRQQNVHYWICLWSVSVSVKIAITTSRWNRRAEIEWILDTIPYETRSCWIKNFPKQVALFNTFLTRTMSRHYDAFPRLGAKFVCAGFPFPQLWNQTFNVWRDWICKM